MFFRLNLIGNLSEDPFLHICEFSNISELSIISRTSKAYRELLIDAISLNLKLRIKSNINFRCSAERAIINCLQAPCGSAKQEEMLIVTVNKFIYFGIRLDLMLEEAARYGPIEVLKFLYNHSRSRNSMSVNAEVARLAVVHNQPAVIELLERSGFNLEEKLSDSNRTLAHLAAECQSIDVLRVLGQAGINFAIDKYDSGLSPLQAALDIKFGESLKKMQDRLKVFSVMLEVGSFPKEGKSAFLDWLSSRFDAAIPRFSDPFGLCYVGYSGDEENSLMSYLAEATNQINKINPFKIAFAEFKPQVETVLEYYSMQYSRATDLKKAYKKNKPESKQEAKDSVSIELQTFKRRLV